MNKKNKLSAAIVSALAVVVGAEAMAETPASDNDRSYGLEEVTVTARRKSENLQVVPDTVVAISSDTVERANITAARDVAARIPNVSLVESLSPTSTYIIVRGIASVRNSEPAVAVIVDGVQIGSSTEVSQSYHDVEQIELLKGPQGALYGRNALGGALIVTSKKPTDELQGKVKVGTGEDGLREVTGSLSGQLTDGLLFRVAGSHKSFDGNIENEFLSDVLTRSGGAVTGPKPSNSYMDFEENNDLRVQLLWEPSDTTAIDYRYSENDIESGAMWYRNIYRLESDPDVTYELPVNSNGNPTAYRGIDTHTVKIDHDLGFGTLTSITNVTDTNERYGLAGETRDHDRTANVWFHTQPFVQEMVDSFDNQVDVDFFSGDLGAVLGGTFVGSDQYYDVQTFSQEFRFSGELNDDLDYIVGAYLLETERKDTIRATWETPDGVAFDCAPKYDGGPSITDFACNGLLFSTQNVQDNTAWAVFFNADYQISDELTLTLAGRYDEDQRTVTRLDGPTVDTFGLGVGNVGADCDSVADPENCSPSGSKISETFSSFQPKVSLAYTPNEQMTFYGTYARGFRSGGFNASGALLTDTYDAETLDSFELGIKTTLMNDRLRANFAMFYQDYENTQQFEFDGNVFVQSLYNIPETEISGIEGSIDFAATENLTVNFAFGLMDSSVVQFDEELKNNMQSELYARNTNTVKLPEATQAAFDRNFEGAHLSNFAHTTMNLGLEHEMAVWENGTLITRVDYSFTDDLYWWLDEQDVQDPLGLVSASIGLAIGENIELQLWCKNCTNEIYDSEFSPNERELFGGAAKDLAYRARGRTSGLRLNYTF